VIFRKFPDIELFHNVVKSAEVYNNPTVYYRSKIKLHGTNAAVRIKDGEIGAQSRTQLITPENDNANFAKWVKSREDWFKSIPCQEMLGNDVAIFGEWCGPGIMKGTAINQIPNKCFVVFAVFSYDDSDTEENATVIVEPDAINKLLGERPNDVHILPWYCDPIKVDFGNRAGLSEVAALLNSHVQEIEPCDPWVKETFGIEGIAEGAVYYPVNMIKLRHWFSNFVFKAKGGKHKVVKTKEAVQVSPEVAATIGEFVYMFVTEARLEQGLAVVGSADAKKTGDFLKWFMSDVFKESVDELEASDLTWEQVSNSVQSAARAWFLSKARKI
jgi:hypothetical protein